MTTAPESAATGSFLGGYSGRLAVPLALGWMGVKLSRDLLPPLLPAISRELAISPTEAGLALTAMGTLYALLQYPGGRLSDQLSRRTVLVGSLAVTAVGVLVLTRVSTYAGLLAGVALVGLGGGLYAIPSRALLSDLFVERRGQAFGVFSAAGRIGSASSAGLAVGALALAAWGAAFLPVAAVLLVVLVMFHAWSREPYVLERVDLGLRETGVRVFATPRFRWLLVSYVLYLFAYRGVIGFLPTFLGAEKGLSSALASGGFALVFVVGIVVTPVAGGLSDRLSRAPVAIGSLVVAGIGLAGLIAAPSIASVAAGLVLFASGLMVYGPVMEAYLMDLFPDESMGGDLGALKTVYQFAGSLGPAYVGAVAEGATYGLAFVGLVVCLLASGAIVAGLTRGRGA